VAVMTDDTGTDLHAQVDRLPMGPLSQTLHALVDAWLRDPTDIWRARYLLQGLREGDAALVRMAFTPYDDEPVTDEERAALTVAEEDARAGRLIPHEEIVRKYVRRP